ncbi:MAG: FISUMP domain-containing protein [Bacteroidales bacterium]|nr:FISUMP domain-containing protein [Bacteroidales bacterium]
MKKKIIYLFAMVFIYSCTPQDAPNTFTDSRDDKVYKTVTIGSQVWMAENLAYLPAVSAPASGSSTEPHCYVYGYAGTDVAAAKATTNYTTYGVLYNWPAAMIACPDGWHLPTDVEWTQLETFLANNGYNYDGSTGGSGVYGVRNKIAKSMASASGWQSFDEDGVIGNTDYPEYINKSGFSALPGGYCDGITTLAFYELGYAGEWWSSTELDGNTAWVWTRRMISPITMVSRSGRLKGPGWSVRCVRD